MGHEGLNENKEAYRQLGFFELNSRIIRNALTRPKINNGRLFLTNPRTGELQRTLSGSCDPANRQALYQLYISFGADLTAMTSWEVSTDHRSGNIRTHQTKLPIDEDTYFLETQTFQGSSQFFFAQIVKPRTEVLLDPEYDLTE